MQNKNNGNSKDDLNIDSKQSTSSRSNIIAGKSKNNNSKQDDFDDENNSSSDSEREALHLFGEYDVSSQSSTTSGSISSLTIKKRGEQPQNKSSSSENNTTNNNNNLIDTTTSSDSTSTTDLTSKKPKKTRLSVMDLFLSGAVAGAVAQTVTAPMDRVKILYQVDPRRVFTMKKAWGTTLAIVDLQSVWGLWRGNGASLVRVLPYAAIVYMSFDTYQEMLKKLGYDYGFASRFIAGALAGCTATALTYPLDLVRARQAAHWGSIAKYKGYIAPLKYIAQSEGSRALFNGLTPTLLGILPYTGISFAIFETLKVSIKNKYGYQSDKEIPGTLRFLAGGAAGLVAQAITYPLHVVRRRMQIQGGTGFEVAPIYKNTWDALKKISQVEGFQKGLYKGFTLNLIKSPIAPAISFCVNDLMKNFLSDLQERLVIHDEPKKDIPLTPIQSLFAGGLAGAVGKTIIAPGDRVKILYQVNPNRSYSVRRAIRSLQMIWRHTGIMGLWRGNGAQMLRVIPYASISYTSFDTYVRFLAYVRGKKDPTARFLAGAGAGATATTLTYPLDLLRARMAAHWHKEPKYQSYIYAFKTIYKTEGALALYKGIAPTLLGVIPYTGLSFTMFGTSKAYYMRIYGLQSEKEIPGWFRLSAGAISGLIAQSATYPLDIIRRRMQVHEKMSESIWGTAKRIYSTEGRRGLYKGLSMNWVKGPIAVGVSFTVNDLMKKAMTEQTD